MEAVQCSKIMNKLFKILILCIATSIYGFGQNGSFDPDQAFKKARTEAFEGNRNEAITLLKTIIEKYPNYDEIRLFLASVYSWEENYKLAKNEYLILIAKDKTNIDYWLPFIKNEIYANENFSAIELTKKAIQLFPSNVKLVILKARAEKNNNELQKAMLTINQFLELNPANKDAEEFKSDLKEYLVSNNFSVSYAVDNYSEIYSPMFYYTLQYSKLTSRGSIIARYNLNKKFNTYGSQFEIDAYPSIAEGLYAYLNIGYSGSTIFPSLRFGVQLYKSLPKSFEVSAGIRSLKFGEDYTNIYTGSIGKYFGNSFVFVVPYFINSDEGWSRSATLTYRKYRANTDQFFAISGGIGFSPEVNRFGFDIVNEPIIGLKSQKIDISNNFRIKNNRNVVGVGGSIIRQESIFDPAKYFWIFSLKISYQIGF
ncbi:outer membrane protein, YaiO family [Spirosomataceae bacterium TFI 002]|nr:outer membrane protein, YaiO family [Spirosomataceae bacterium TFI 002]